MGKLSVVVTHYQEPTDVIQPLFDSIQLQQGIDFADLEILLVQDGKTAVLEPSWFKRYKYPVRWIQCQKQGVSACRNRGMDESAGDYVMFCDADDMFCNVFGIHLILQAMEENPDVIGSKFVEENKIVAPYKLIGHENDMTFIHGKAFQKAYLAEKGIRFHEDQTKHEDSPFVFLAFQATDKIKYLATPFYCWRWNDNSVMRSIGTGKALLYTYPELMRTKDLLLTDMKAQDLPTKKFVAKCLMDCYYDFQKQEFVAGENAEKISVALESVKDFYLKYKDEYYENEPSVLAECMMVARSMAYAGGMRCERMTLQQFLGILMKLSSGAA